MANKAFVTILTKYSDFANIFSEKYAIVLLKYTKINTYAIDLKKDKQLPYGLIYSLGLMELENLKNPYQNQCGQ